MKIEVDDRMRKRKKRKKKIILFLSVFIVFFFTIAYAGLKETNHIEGSTQISGYHIDFDYTGSVQEFVVPTSGFYKIECWGASGGHCFQHAAGGGSSFISGYEGCDAIDESSSETHIIHTGKPNHYSGKIFTNSQMIDGASSMPNPRGNGTIFGNEGNGYVRITFLSE